MATRRIGMPRFLNFSAILLLLLSAAFLFVCTAARAAIDPPFQFNILDINWTAPGNVPTVTFSVTDPNTGTDPSTATKYDLTTDPAFTTAGVSSLTLQIGWDTRDYTNTTDYNTTTGYTIHDPGLNCKNLAAFGRFGNGAAYPIPISVITNTRTPDRGLLASSVTINSDRTYTVPSRCPLPSNVTGTGVVGMHGRAAGLDPATALYTVRIPVTGVVKYFPITDILPVPRRTVVDVNKCLRCHGATKSDGTLVAPVFTFHGASRTKEPQLCVICHNPNQTDIPFRLPGDPTSGDGPETSVDFKRMVHGIHATSAGFRHTPYTVIGFNHSINTFRDYKFPGNLRNCVNCHFDRDATRRLGTFELPLGPNVLGTTVDTKSTYTQDPVTLAWKSVADTGPANDLNITPTAAVCSGCHDNREVKSHMIRTGGASFGALQSEIGYMDGSGRIVRPGKYVERCVNCHGPGKDKDVRKVHEISSKTGQTSDDD